MFYGFHYNFPEAKLKKIMDWIHRKRRGPEWKQGWTEQTLSSISTPPLPLLSVFAIVIFLLSLSHYASYKEQMSNVMINFKIVLFLVPVLLVFLLRSSLLSGGTHLWSYSQQGRQVRQELARGMAGFPWGVMVLVAALLVLVSYQSSFQSMWFPFGRSD